MLHERLLTKIMPIRNSYSIFKRLFYQIVLSLFYLQAFAAINSQPISSETRGSYSGNRDSVFFNQTLRDARLIDQLQQNDINQLPVGIKHNIGNSSYTVAFYKAESTQDKKLLLAAALEV